MAKIDTWYRQRGRKLGIGYHYVVFRDGQIEAGRPEYMISAHCQNHNAHSIGVCYEGGLDIRRQPADTRTPCTEAALGRFAQALSEDPDRRSPRPESAQDLPVHRECHP